MDRKPQSIDIEAPGASLLLQGYRLPRICPDDAPAASMWHSPVSTQTACHQMSVTKRCRSHVGKELSHVEGRIELRDVTFSYPAREIKVCCNAASCSTSVRIGKQGKQQACQARHCLSKLTVARAFADAIEWTSMLLRVVTHTGLQELLADSGGGHNCGACRTVRKWQIHHSAAFALYQLPRKPAPPSIVLTKQPVKTALLHLKPSNISDADACAHLSTRCRWLSSCASTIRCKGQCC